MFVRKYDLKKPINLYRGKSDLVGSEMPARQDFRTEVTIAHLDIKGLFNDFFTAHVEVALLLRKARFGGSFFSLKTAPCGSGNGYGDNR